MPADMLRSHDNGVRNGKSPERVDALQGQCIAFQPAEEIGAGAESNCHFWKIDNIDESFAIRINSGLPIGSFAVEGGQLNASCDIFKNQITGKSSHVGRPHLGHNASDVVKWLLALRNHRRS